MLCSRPRCGHPIKWEEKDGRRNCYNLDGTEHWDICANLQFDYWKKHGQHFEETVGQEHRKGYRLGNKVQYYEISGTIIKGKGFKLTEHLQECNAPPWEDCSCGKST